MNKKLLQVSADTLAGIDWMGASRLVSVMEQAATRGPFDRFTWKKFITRAELIAITNGFRPIQVSRILRYMNIANYKDERFLRKLHSLIDDNFVANSDIGTFCGIIQGFKRLNYPENDYKLILDSYKDFFKTLVTDDYFQLSLLLNAYTHSEYSDIICKIIDKIVKNIPNVPTKALSIVTNCITRISFNNTDFEQYIPVLFESILDRSDQIDLHSSIILLNSLSRVPKFSKNIYIDLLSDKIIKNANLLNLKQIVMILRSLHRLKYTCVELLTLIMTRMELMLSQAEPLQLSSIVAAIKSLNIKNQNLMDSISTCILNNIGHYNISHLSQLAYRIFNATDYTIFTKHEVLLRLLSNKLEENIDELTVHDIVLLCLSLGNYWNETSEFNGLKLKLLDQATRLIKGGESVSNADREALDKMYIKCVNK